MLNSLHRPCFFESRPCRRTGNRTLCANLGASFPGWAGGRKRGNGATRRGIGLPALRQVSKSFSPGSEAKHEKRGLYSLPEAKRIPPWEWRHPAAVSSAAQTVTKIRMAEGFTCGSKRTCGQMTSCAEASFYLERCWLSRLDGNRDNLMFIF